MKVLTGRNDHPLFSALEAGNIKEIEKCLSDIDNVLARSTHHTLIHSAVLSDDGEVVKYIIEKINETQGYVWPYINTKDTEGDTPLNWSAEGGYVNAAKMLLEYGADVEAENNDGVTALHWTAKNNHIEIMKLLICKGANINVKDSNGLTPMDYAKEQGHDEISGYLTFSVAELFRQQTKYNEAQQAYQEAIRIQEVVLGPEHVDTLMSRHNLAVVLADQGKHNEALDIYQKVFDIQKRDDVLGPHHPQTLKTRYNMAIVFGEQGNNIEVSKIFYEILSIIGPKLSPDYLHTLMARNSMEETFDDQSHDFSEDLRIFRRVLSFKEDKSDSDHTFNPTRSNIKMIENKNMDTEFELSDDGDNEVKTDLDITRKNKITNGVDILDDFTETKVKEVFSRVLSNSEERQEVLKVDEECFLSECDELEAIKKNVTEHLEYRFRDMNLVRGNENPSGKKAWHYVLVDPLKRNEFQERIGSPPMNVANYGKILESGWGDNPPQDLQDKFESFTKKISDDLFVKMEEYENINFYIFVLTDSEKREIFQEKSKKYLSLSDIKQNCVGVLHSGWGQDPPESISDKIINTYFCTNKWMLKEKFPNPSDKDCENIHDAARNCKLDELKGFVARRINVNITDENGWTPLHHAAYVGNLEVVKYLIDSGAHINVKDKICGRMPLHIAAREGHNDVIELFLNKRKFLMKIVNINDVDEMNWTPLHYAAWNGHLNVVQLLINKRANIHANETTCGKKPLHIAAERGHIDMLKLFLKSGNSVDDTDKDGRTSLYYAAWRGHLEVVNYLIDINANIHAETVHGTKPIHTAALSCKNVVEFLLDRGANVNDLTKENSTPLHYAASAGQLEVVKFLIKKGAKLNARDNNGNTPSDDARKHGHLQIVDILDSLN